MVQIKLTDLVPNKYNPRELFRGAAMEELKASMNDGGLIQPILVRSLKNGKHEVVAGMRRYYAAKDLEWESIECHSRKLSDFEAVLMAYTENVQREDLTPIEQGKMYRNLRGVLIKKFKENGNFNKVKKPMDKIWEQMENTIKLSHVQMRKYISLLELPKELQSLIELSHGDKKKGFGVVYGFGLARLPKEEIMEFYEIYNPKDYSIDQYNKKISEKIAESKLEGEKKRKKLEGNLDKAQLELEKLVQRKEAFEERINKNLEKLENEYDDVKKAIDFLLKQLEEFQSEEKLGKLAKDLKNYESKVDDLDILLVRTEEESISICPYCLAKIDIGIINKRKEFFEGEIKDLRDELQKMSSTMDFNRNLKRDLESDDNLLEEVLAEIKQKEKESEGILGEIEGL